MSQNKKVYKTEREGQIERVITASKKDYVIIDRCVDEDTEYFNGEKWKKIKDYKNGENVLASMTLLKKKKFFVQQNLNKILLFCCLDRQKTKENRKQKYLQIPHIFIPLFLSAY